jgi:putative transposase
MTTPHKAQKPAPDTIRELPDPLWDILESILPETYPARPIGRPRVDLRRVLDGIVFRMRTGCRWDTSPTRPPVH